MINFLLLAQHEFLKACNQSYFGLHIFKLNRKKGMFRGREL